MGTGSAGGTGVDDPGLTVIVDQLAMGMAIDHNPRLRMSGAQIVVGGGLPVMLVAMLDLDDAAGQLETRNPGQGANALALLGRPDAFMIVVSGDRDDPARARLQAIEDAAVEDITGMNGDIAIAHQLLDFRMQCAMSVGNQGYADGLLLAC